MRSTVLPLSGPPEGRQYRPRAAPGLRCGQRVKRGGGSCAIMRPIPAIAAGLGRSCQFYRLFVGRGLFTDKHLVVVVKYVEEPDGRRGYVSTLYLSRTVYARGVQLWPKMEIQES